MFDPWLCQEARSSPIFTKKEVIAATIFPVDFRAGVPPTVCWCACVSFREFVRDFRVAFAEKHEGMPLGTSLRFIVLGPKTRHISAFAC